MIPNRPLAQLARLARLAPLAPLAPITAGAFALLLLAAGPADAQRRATPPPAKPAAAAQPDNEPFLDTLDVTVVNVEVYVTDKKGNRVTGLTRDDFELFEDRRPVAITNFYAVEGGKPILADDGSGAVEPGDAAAPPAAANAPALPEDQRLALVIYIDNFNIHPFNRNRVMRDLRTFLRDNIQRGDRVMLVSYDRELHVRRPLTGDPDSVASALLELEKVTGFAVHHESERRDALKRIEESNSAAEASAAARSYAGSVFNDLSFSIEALKNMVTSLAGLPGRKAVMYVSDGVPMIAGQDMFYAVHQKFPDSSSLTETFQFDASRRFNELTNQANANRVTFYAVDAGGLRTYSSFSAESEGSSLNQGGFLDSIQISNMQSPLQAMARETGGQVVLNANNPLPQLQRIAADFGTFYSLGYTPTHSGDGRYYKIEVKTKRKGLQVRHREGYRDKSVDSRMNDGTLAALQFPFEENPLGVSLEFGAGTRRDDGLFVVPVEVRIPLGKVLLVPREQTQEASVRLWVAAMDEKGDTSDVQQARVPITVPTAQLAAAKEKHYVYVVSLLMRKGTHKVAIGVRDEAASEASFVSRSVNVGS
jgi:VWFA-related protein